MKHHVFLLVSIFSFSVNAMQYDAKNMTKSQFINTLTVMNYYIKQNCPSDFDTKDFGKFIVGLRSIDIDTFESKKEELASLLIPLNVFDQTEFS